MCCAACSGAIIVNLLIDSIQPAASVYRVITISSQRYLDDETVEIKRAEKDYVVSYIEVELEGVEYRIIVDGHHSLAAAILDGATPEWERSTSQDEANAMGAQAWLESHEVDCEWYDHETGCAIF